MKKILSTLFVVIMLLGLLTGAAFAAGFNASFELTESQDGNTVTITIQELPEGQMPILSVPCGDAWKQATVTKDGNAISGEVTIEFDEDIGANYVNFEVTEGGTYVITNTTPTPDPDPEPGDDPVDPDPGDDPVDPDPGDDPVDPDPGDDPVDPDPGDDPVIPNPNPDPGPSAPVVPSDPDSGVTETPIVDTSAPVVDSTITENEDGSSTKTETLENGAVVETTTKPDGSSVSVATKAETVETETGKTTTTVTNTTSTDAFGTVVKESREEVVVETEKGITTNTTVVTESEEKTETTVTESKTTVNEDGTETTITTATTEIELVNGSTGITVKDAEGKVTADVTISEKAVSDAVAGETVTLPMPAVESTASTETAPVINVTTSATEEVTIEIPVVEAKPGTVVVLVHEDGTEEVVTKTVQTENGLAVKVEGNVTVKVVDNAKDFHDTDDHWAEDAIDHATSRQMFDGMGEGRFQPDTTMNRAMLATVLWRMEGKQKATTEADFRDLEEGHWSEEAVHWAAENEIIKGDNGAFNGEGAVTREQMVTMLYRMSGSPKVAAEDAVDGASDWAADAVAWAVKIGLMQGDGNGLDLQGTATRAQIATFLMRFMNLNP